MSITKAIPELWSGAIKANLLAGHVFGQAGVVNRDYEGDLSGYGDTVHIISVAPVTIKDYTKNTAIDDPEVLTDDELLLTVDQAKYFNFAVDDIDAAQTRPKVMGEATRTAGWGLRDKSDLFIAAKMVSEGTNLDASQYDVAGTGHSMYDLLVDMDTKLTKNKVPTGGRWAAVGPDQYALLRKDERFLHATALGDAVLQSNSVIGQVAGLTVLQTLNQPVGTGKTPGPICIAGHSMGASFAEQIDKVEPYRPQKGFSDALKGLYVYGGKVIYPEALVWQELKP